MKKDMFENELVNALEVKANEMDWAFNKGTNAKNGVNKKYVSIFKKTDTSTVAPVLYVDELYEMYKKDEDMQKVIDNCVSIFTESKPKPDLKYDSSKIRYFLVSKTDNDDFLKDKLTIDIPGTDLTKIIKLDITVDETHDGTVTFTNELLKYFNKTGEEVIADAEKNLSEMKVKMMPIEKRIFCFDKEFENVESDELEKDGLNIITSNNGEEGSVLITRKDVLDKAFYQMEGSFYIIPSSIHEVLIIKHGFMPQDKIRFMIQEVNKEMVRKEDKLSDNLYVYDGYEIKLAV